MRRTEFRQTEIWRPIGSLFLTQIILHSAASFEFLKNYFSNNIFLLVAFLSRKLIVPSGRLTFLLWPAILWRALPISSPKHDINSVKEKFCFQKLIKINLLKWIWRLIATKLAEKFCIPSLSIRQILFQ